MVRNFGPMITDRRKSFWLEIIYGGSTSPSDLTLKDTEHSERSYTVCVVGGLYASKIVCGWAGISALWAVFLFQMCLYRRVFQYYSSDCIKWLTQIKIGLKPGLEGNKAARSFKTSIKVLTKHFRLSVFPPWEIYGLLNILNIFILGGPVTISILPWRPV